MGRSYRKTYMISVENIVEEILEIYFSNRVRIVGFDEKSFNDCELVRLLVENGFDCSFRKIHTTRDDSYEIDLRQINLIRDTVSQL